MYALPYDIYSQLLQFLHSEAPSLESGFAANFTQNGNYYVCNDYNAYMTWLANSGLFEQGDSDYGDFIAWDQTMLGISNQGGGTFKITF